ncbi:MAG TPA: LLM class flavin-dependent oxidoreductase [Chloroflexota bacterium]|nr:LLM class flavin-dependent oxidoreductase [Chloroflexota bacterium]
MRFGIHVHAFGVYADPRVVVELAREAEDAGWDGVFVNDHLAARTTHGPSPVANPWIALAAIATSTTRVRIGPMVAALPRRRPWQIASETVTLDHLSGGRLILGVGSGTGIDRSFTPFSETRDLRTRAALLDESLDILSGLWRGQPFSFSGRHFTVKDAAMRPSPLQRPRIPVWIAGHWPHRRPFDRAARWDGMFVDADGTDWLRGEIVPPDTLRACVDYTRSRRREAGRDGPFDVAIGGFSPKDRSAAVERLAPYAGAGLTWWVEGIRDGLGTPEEHHTTIRRGPPRA